MGTLASRGTESIEETSSSALDHPLKQQRNQSSTSFSSCSPRLGDDVDSHMPLQKKSMLFSRGKLEQQANNVACVSAPQSQQESWRLSLESANQF